MKVGLLGARGRLGSEIRCELLREGMSVFDIERTDIATADSLSRKISDPAVIVDASLPAGTERLCLALTECHSTHHSLIRGLVIGSTGHSAAQLATIEKASKYYPICLVSNFSRGIFLFEQLLNAKTESGKSVCELARSLGFDFSLHEVHHIRKLDAPSGTAKSLAAVAGLSEERISSQRVGQVVGEHELLFSADAEELRIRHVAQSRKLFALGAVRLTKHILSAHLAPGLVPRAEIDN